MKIQSPAEERTSIGRARLLMDFPFFGVPSLKLTVETCESIPTAATDGERLLINPRYCLELPGMDLIGLVAHETFHCMLAHFARRGNREFYRWNVACDHVINLLLKSAGIRIPAGALCDPQYENMNAEVVYDLLPDGVDYKKLIQNNPFGVVMDAPDGKPGGGEGGEEESEAAPSVGGKGAKGDQDGGDSAPGRAYAEELAEEWTQVMDQAAQMAQAQGKLPAFLERLVKKIVFPDPDLIEKLRAFLDRASRNDYNWCIPNRRFVMTGAIVPTLRSKSELPPFVVVMDTSGSISNRMIQEMGGTLQDVLDTYETEVTALYVDARAHNHEVFSSGDVVSLHPKGGGGTDFRPAFQWVKKQDADPCCLVYITDMFGTFPKEAPPYPVLWVVKGSYADYPKPPFGEIVGAGSWWKAKE